jgi:hypothetical protein
VEKFGKRTHPCAGDTDEVDGTRVRAVEKRVAHFVMSGVVRLQIK